MKKKKWWILGLILLVAAASGFYYYEQRSVSNNAKQSAASNARGSIMPVQKGDITRKIESSGTISGARQADLGFGSGGKVQKVNVEVGQPVNKGDVLAEMDRTQQELALMKAQNAYDLAQISGTNNAKKEAELDLKVAKTNLENTTIIAPFSGIVTDVGLEEGEQASSSSTAVSLLDNSVFYADILVDELDMYQVSLGQLAIVKVDALGDQLLEGEVSQIGMIAQSSGGITTVPVTIKIINGPTELKVGYSATVTIEVERVNNVFKVPVEAVIRRGSQSLITIIRDGEEKTIEVSTGLSDGLNVEVRSGLEENDQIVGFNFALYDSTRNSAGSRNMGAIRMGGFR